MAVTVPHPPCFSSAVAVSVARTTASALRRECPMKTSQYPGALRGSGVLSPRLRLTLPTGAQSAAAPEPSPSASVSCTFLRLEEAAEAPAPAPTSAAPVPRFRFASVVSAAPPVARSSPAIVPVCAADMLSGQGEQRGLLRVALLKDDPENGCQTT